MPTLCMPWPHMVSLADEPRSQPAAHCNPLCDALGRPWCYLRSNPREMALIPCGHHCTVSGAWCCAPAAQAGWCALHVAKLMVGCQAVGARASAVESRC